MWHHDKTLGFWTTAMPSAEEKYTPFEKQLLVSYWALEDTKHFSRGHQVTMPLELIRISWVQSDLPSIMSEGLRTIPHKKMYLSPTRIRRPEFVHEPDQHVFHQRCFSDWFSVFISPLATGGLVPPDKRGSKSLIWVHVGINIIFGCEPKIKRICITGILARHGLEHQRQGCLQVRNGRYRMCMKYKDCCSCMLISTGKHSPWRRHRTIK